MAELTLTHLRLLFRAAVEGVRVASRNRGVTDGAAGVGARRALIEGAPAQPLRAQSSLGYHSAADTEVTAPQIAAQSPSDRSNTTAKETPASDH